MRTSPRLLAARVHRLRLQRRVAVLLRDVVVDRLRGRVQEIAVEAHDRPVGDDVLVHRVVGPARAAPVEQPHVPVRVALAVREPAAEEAVAPRDRVGRRRGHAVAERGADRALERGRHALVGVEAQHPVVLRGRDREVLLRAEAAPRFLEHARAAAPRDFHGIIAAARVDHDRLRGERRRREARLEILRGVARDHHQRERQRAGHAEDAREAVVGGPRDSTWSAEWRGERMSGILVVRPSSLGDVVWALAIAQDAVRARPGTAVDWVVEEAFAALPAMCADVRRAIPVALRRWRRSPLAPATWREIDRVPPRPPRATATTRCSTSRSRSRAASSRASRAAPATASTAPASASPSRPGSTTCITRCRRRLHFAVRVRTLAGAALGYAVEAPPRWRWTLPAPPSCLPARPFVVAVHATARGDKRWPTDRWRALIAGVEAAGFDVVLPHGTDDEEAHSRALAADARRAIVPPRLALDAMAALLARAHAVVGVDTGLTHLAAALGTPTLALFTTTDATLAGVAVAGAARARPRRQRRRARRRRRRARRSANCCRDAPRC